MLKKKLMSLGIVVIFTLSSLTTTVSAADFSKASAGTNVTVKVTNPGKGNDKDKKNDVKNNQKKYKFNDSDVDLWARDAIEKLAGKGILGGVGNGKFAPKNNVTQMEALAMVMRLTGDNKEADSRGKQIHPLYNGVMPTWGYGYIYVAIEKKILLPEELKNFNPATPAKRHEIAKYIIRALGKTDEALKYMDEDLPFNDAKAVPEKSVGYVYLVNELKIMSGNNNNFKPNSPITRAEMAVILDRAEGKFDLPDTDNRKNNIVFISEDASENEITVKVKGVNTTYDVLDGVQVYKNGAFMDLEDLVSGDVLELTFNNSKQVIFIEVVKNVEDVENTETKLSFSEVDYTNLPEALQDKVDALKDTKNYKAFEYNGYVYLFASMGEKSTGGYDIVIDEVYKVENDNDFIVKAVVDTDEPSSSDVVTQSVTHPYIVVKFKNFSDIDFVKFVDSDDDKLAEADIVKLTAEDVEENEVTVEAVDYDALASRLREQVDYLKLSKNYKAYEYGNYVYLIATMGRKSSSGYDINIENVYKAESGNDYTIKAVVDTDTTSANDNTVTYPYSIIRFRQFDNIEAVKFFDEDNNKLAETKVIDLDELVNVEGTISSITTSSRTIRVEKSNGSVVTLSIPNDAVITVNGDENESFSDLVKGMTVSVEITDQRVAKVIAEDKLTEVNGTLTGISISTEQKITLKEGTSQKVYTVPSNVKVTIDGSTARVEDLRINSELTLKFTNGILVEIVK